MAIKQVAPFIRSMGNKFTSFQGRRQMAIRNCGETSSNVKFVEFNDHFIEKYSLQLQFEHASECYFIIASSHYIRIPFPFH